MAQFCEIGSNYINLDRVAKFEYTRDKDPKKSTLLIYFVDGEVKRISECSGFRLDEILGVVIPAAPGFHLFQYWFWNEEPTAADIDDKIYLNPIVAWRVKGLFAEPVCPDDVDGPNLGKGMKIICYPDGHFCDPFNRDYRDKASLLEDMREEWAKWKKSQEPDAKAS
jgi:hypothetical protein